MFLIRRVWLAAFCVSLAACDASPPTVEEMEQAAANMVSPEPGMYRSTSQLSSFELPGASPQEAERMRAMMGMLEAQESTLCMTQQDSDEGWTSMLRAMQQGSCEVSSFDADATRFQAEMACSAAGGVLSQMIMTGTGTTQSSRMEVEIKQQGPAIPGGELEMRFEVENERIGDC